MRSIKLVNGLLWTANAGLGAAIVIFVVQQLVLPEDGNLLQDVVMDEEVARAPVRTPPKDWSPLKNLTNPVEPMAAPTGPAAASSIRADLVGTIPSPEKPEEAVAFLFLPARKVSVNAYHGEPVMDGENAVAELAGWTLKSVTRVSATFTNGSREETLRLDSGLADAGGPASGGAGAMDKSKLDVRKLAENNNRATYAVDKATAEWVLANQEAVLNEIGLQDYASGGIQVVSIQPDAVASKVGLQQYDVIKSLNGQPVANSLSLAELRNSPQLKRANSLVIGIERGGQARTIVIQPSGR